MFDLYVPEELKKMQTWFGRIISTPLVDLNFTQEVTRAGKNIQEDAKNYIVKSPTLEPHQRIEIYNQQYWWRLLSILHETYPLVVRLFGYYAFNQRIGIPYLDACPPKHWALAKLGDRLYAWAKKHWDDDKDKELLLHAIQIDGDFNSGFTAQEGLPLKGDNLETQTLHLQPYVRLYELPYRLFDFRQKMLAEEPDYWVDHPFPDLKHEKCYYVLYRNKKYDLVYLEIEEEEFRVLKRFEKPSSIEEVCGWLEAQDEAFVAFCAPRLQEWFARWTALSLFHT